MKIIQIGKTSFSVDYLQSVTLTEAKAHYKLFDERIVKEAYYKANPKRKRKKD